MIFQTYAGLDTLNATEDLSNIFIYVNSITNNAAMPVLLFAFWIIALLASYFAEMKFGRPRFPVSFAVAGFATFGLAVILSLKNGLLNPLYLLVSLGLAVIGIAWLYLDSSQQY